MGAVIDDFGSNTFNLVAADPSNVVLKVALFHLMYVRHYRILFLFITHLHSCPQKSRCKSCHILYRAFNQEFFDDVLICKRLNEPDTQLDILSHCILEELDIDWDLSPALRPDCDCYEETYLEL